MFDSKHLTFSRTQCAKTCLKKHYFQYELGIRKDRQGAPLRIGGNYHLGLDLRGQGKSIDDSILGAIAGYQEIPEWATSGEWLEERETVSRLLHAYFHIYANDQTQVIATEQTFDLPIVNPETGAESRTFRLAGKIDKILKLADGRLVVMEHKTTGDSIGPDSDYWPRLRLDTQISIYVYAARKMGFDVETVLYDVAHKPGMSYYKATPLDKRKFTKEGKLYANMRETDETPEEFGERLTADMFSRPDFYFARREIPRLESDLKEFEQELWHSAKLIRECQLNDRWFRNTAACCNPFPCDYQQICFGGLNPVVEIPAGYKKVDALHPELENENGTSESVQAPAYGTSPAA